jgi:DNA mismatch repair protein MutS2
MLQCGLLPSAKEDSVFGIFNKIFVDIGDEQSLENDLSTYTSKLLNIKYFLENLDDHSLFLIDEFGTGTDPGLGGAIAEASLEKFNEKKSFGVVTTHYSNLKLLAGRLNGVINGAMLFDSRKMKPLYQLKTGKPGSSFAFEIANQIGFPKDVLENAALVTGKKQLDFEKQIQDIEVEKNEVAKKAVEIKVADEFLDELIKKYQKLTEDLEKSKYEILLKAREDALHLLSDSNRVLEKTIKEIRESQADKEITKKGRAAVDKLKEDLRQTPGILGESKPEVTAKKPVTILIPDQKPQPYQSFIDDFQQKLVSFQVTIDLRGKRADEAVSMIQHYIDDAILLNIPEVRILHGKGNGILRQVTREFLGTVKEVKKFTDEALERGGPGITVVSFK